MNAEDIGGMVMNKDLVMGVYSFSEYLSGYYNQKRFYDKKSSIHSQIKVKSAIKDWNEYISNKYQDYRLIQAKHGAGWIIDDTTDSYIDYYISSNTVTVDISGDKAFVHCIKEDIESNFDLVESYIKWIYSQNFDSITTALNTEMLPKDSMYPFLKNESLTDYYDRYLNSTSNVLLLIGKPGTGKTTFLRGLIQYAKTSATVTYDPEILNKDSIFADFIDDDECNIMVLEDADTLLMARKEGNSLMQRFLNVGDGLVTSAGKKLIFSTNLESTTDIDPALLRPGRLFDIVQFELLTKEQAQKVAEDFNIEINHDSEFYSIAEIFHDKIDCKNTKRKFGFI